MCRGAVLLRAYLVGAKLTQLRFAAKSGVPQCQLSAYLRGRRKPGRTNAGLLEEATGGAVPAQSWDEPDEPKESRRRRRKAAASDVVSQPA